MNTSIYRLGFNNFYSDTKHSYIKPLQVGTLSSQYEYGYLYKDSTGTNIANLYPYYGYLTGLYWVWKNDKTSDYIGIFHANFMLNLGNELFDVNQLNQVCFDSEITFVNDPKKYSDTILDIENMEQLLQKNDILNSAPLTLEDDDNYANLITKRGILPQDLEAFKALLTKNQEEILNNLLTKKKFLLPVFVMSNKAFKAYTKFIFSILTKLEHDIKIFDYITRNIPIFQHFGDLLHNIFMLENAEKYTQLERQLIAFKITVLEPHFLEEDDNSIQIFLGFDNSYIPPAAALLKSIVDSSSKKNQYYINCICESVSINDRLGLKSILDDTPNIRIRFIDANSLYKKDTLKSRDYYSPVIYARLFIPKMFPNLKKCIYLDTDMIVKTDLANLWNIDIGDNYLGAVRDFGIHAEKNLYLRRDPQKTNLINREQYTQETLGIKNLTDYFQSSLLVFNLAKIRDTKKDDELLQTLYSGFFLHQDQDILNKVFTGNIYYLEYEWAVTCTDVRDSITFYGNMDFSLYRDYLSSFQNIKIAHFLGKTKPWNSPNIINAELYFKNIANTPFRKTKTKSKANAVSPKTK